MSSSAIRVQRGQSVRWRMRLTKAGVPIDLTGGQWEVLEPTSKPTVTVVVQDAPAGISYLLIDKDQTKGMNVGKRPVRLRFVFPDGSAMAVRPIMVEFA